MVWLGITTFYVIAWYQNNAHHPTFESAKFGCEAISYKYDASGKATALVTNIKIGGHTWFVFCHWMLRLLID